MRLMPEQVKIIRDTVHALLGPEAHVRLFGSRVDDSASGGDIDLFIEVGQAQANRAATVSRLAAELQIALGDQRIDIILVDPNTAPQPIHEIARRQGIGL